MKNLIDFLKAKFTAVVEWFRVEQNREFFSIGLYLVLAPVAAFLTGSKITDFGFQNVLHGLVGFSLILAGIVGTILVIAWDINPMSFSIFKSPFVGLLDFVKEIVKYIGWASLQQISLVATFLTLGNIAALSGPVGWIYVAILAAFMFAFLFHRPNMMLVLATFSLGLVNMLYFHDKANIAALFFIHGIGGAMLSRFMPPVLSTSFRILSSFKETQTSLNEK